MLLKCAPVYAIKGQHQPPPSGHLLTNAVNRNLGCTKQKFLQKLQAEDEEEAEEPPKEEEKKVPFCQVETDE